MFQVEYEAWKLREMKRLKRDREEVEAVAKEQAELERLRNLTEEERRLPTRLNLHEMVETLLYFLQD